MAEKKSQSENKYGKLIIAVICIVVGILFCCSLVAEAVQVLSYIIGAVLIVIGLVAIISIAIKKQSLLSVTGLLGAIFLGLGIATMVLNAVGFVLACIPFLLISLGALAITDAFLLKFQRKEKNILAFVIELVIGVIFLVFGILLLTVDVFDGYAGLIFGLALIVYGLFTLIVECIKLGKKK